MTFPPGQSVRTVACTVNLATPPGGRTSCTRVMGPDAEAGFTDPPEEAVAVQLMAVSAGESDGSLIVAWATVVVLVFVTVTV